MDKNRIQNIFDRICVKLHNEGIGNIDVAYIDYDETPDDSYVMKPVFIAFKDRDLLEYFKLAFTSDTFELRPTVNNPLADPNLMAMELYYKVKDYYVQWRKQQLAGAPFGSQSSGPCVRPREKAVSYDPAVAFDSKAFDKADAALRAKLTGAGAVVFDRDKATIKVNLGTASHTKAPWDDPLKEKLRAEDVAKSYNYTMRMRVDYIRKAMELLMRNKKFIFTDQYFSGDNYDINCKLTIRLPNTFPAQITTKKLNFDIPDRMFDCARHILDDSVHIPADEKHLSNKHLILRLAYIIFKATQLRDRERINNEVIKVREIKTTESYDF